jgi:hypothetical protein
MGGGFVMCCRLFGVISFVYQKPAGIIVLLNQVKPEISRFFERIQVIGCCSGNESLSKFRLYVNINTGDYHNILN